MITVNDLHFSYGAHEVFKGLTFHLAPGGVTALLGCNGAGKTTLFRCLLGLETAYRGSIQLEGKALSSYTPRQLAHRMAYIPQNSYPAFQYSALDMVLMGMTSRIRAFSSPGSAEIAQAMSALERLQIAHLAQRSFIRLSGGERQLVLIARAIAQQARILLMDEPCASLDFGNQHRVMQTAQALGREGYSLIMSTHSPQHVLSYADRMLAIRDGKLLCEGAPAEKLTPRLVQELYGIAAHVLDTPFGRVVLPEADEEAHSS